MSKMKGFAMLKIGEVGWIEEMRKSVIIRGFFISAD